MTCEDWDFQPSWTANTYSAGEHLVGTWAGVRDVPGMDPVIVTVTFVGPGDNDYVATCHSDPCNAAMLWGDGDGMTLGYDLQALRADGAVVGIITIWEQASSRSADLAVSLDEDRHRLRMVVDDDRGVGVDGPLTFHLVRVAE